MRDIKITDVRAVPGDSAFLLDDGKTTIMYDSGFAFTGYRVAENISNILGKRGLDYVFLTHSHYDHALGSVYAKRRWQNAKVVAGDYATRIFAKPTARAVMRDLDGKFAKQCGVNEYEDLIDELCVDIEVKDGDIINAGDMKIRAVALPGHTKCSVGYYIEENKLLLGTETIGVYGGDKGVVVPSYLIGYNTALESIRRVKLMDIDNILVPHYGLLSKSETADYLAAAEESAVSTAEDIASILRAGGSDGDAFEYFKNRFYHGYIRSIYPIDAMTLNTSIMIKLIRKEIMGQEI